MAKFMKGLAIAVTMILCLSTIPVSASAVSGIIGNDSLKVILLYSKDTPASSFQRGDTVDMTLYVFDKGAAVDADEVNITFSYQPIDSYIDINGWVPGDQITHTGTGEYRFTHVIPNDVNYGITYYGYARKGVNEDRDSRYVSVDTGLTIDLEKSGRSVPGGTVSFTARVEFGNMPVAPSSFSMKVYDASSHPYGLLATLTTQNPESGKYTAQWTIPEEKGPYHKNYMVKAEASLDSTRADRKTAEARTYIFLGLHTHISFDEEPAMGQTLPIKVECLYGDQYIEANDLTLDVYDLNQQKRGDFEVVESLTPIMGDTGVYTAELALPTEGEHPEGIRYFVRANGSYEDDWSVDVRDILFEPRMEMERLFTGSFEWGETYSWEIRGFFGQNQVDLEGLQVYINDTNTGDPVDIITPTRTGTGRYEFSYTLPSGIDPDGLSHDVTADGSYNNQPLQDDDNIYLAPIGFHMNIWSSGTNAPGDTISLSMSSTDSNWNSADPDNLFLEVFEGIYNYSSWSYDYSFKENLTDQLQRTGKGRYGMDFTIPSSFPPGETRVSYRFMAKGIYMGGSFTAEDDTSVSIYYYFNADLGFVDTLGQGSPVADDDIPLTFDTFISDWGQVDRHYVGTEEFTIQVMDASSYQGWNDTLGTSDYEVVEDLTSQATETSTGRYTVNYHVAPGTPEGEHYIVRGAARYGEDWNYEDIHLQDTLDMEVKLLDANGDTAFANNLAPGDVVKVDILGWKNNAPLDLFNVSIEIYDISDWPYVLLVTINSTSDPPISQISTGHYQGSYTLPSPLPVSIQFEVSADSEGQVFGDYPGLYFGTTANVYIIDPADTAEIGPGTEITFEGTFKRGASRIDAFWTSFEVYDTNQWPAVLIENITPTQQKVSTGTYRASFTIPKDINMGSGTANFEVRFKAGFDSSNYQDNEWFSFDLNIQFTQITGGNWNYGPGDSIAYLVEVKAGGCYVDADLVTASVRDSDQYDHIMDNDLLVERGDIVHIGTGMYEVSYTIPDSLWREVDYDLRMEIWKDNYHRTRTHSIQIDAKVDIMAVGLPTPGSEIEVHVYTSLGTTRMDFDEVNIAVYDITGIWDFVGDIDPVKLGLTPVANLDATREDMGYYTAAHTLPSTIDTETRYLYYVSGNIHDLTDTDGDDIVLSYYYVWFRDISTNRAVTGSSSTFDLNVVDKDFDPVAGATVDIELSYRDADTYEKTIRIYSGTTDASGKADFEVTYENTRDVTINGIVSKNGSTQRFNHWWGVPYDAVSDIQDFEVVPDDYDIPLEGSGSRTENNLDYTTYNGSGDHPNELHPNQPIYYYIYNNTEVRDTGSTTTNAFGDFQVPFTPDVRGRWNIDFESPIMPNGTDNPSNDGKEYGEDSNDIDVVTPQDPNEMLDEDVVISVDELKVGEPVDVTVTYPEAEEGDVAVIYWYYMDPSAVGGTRGETGPHSMCTSILLLGMLMSLLLISMVGYGGMYYVVAAFLILSMGTRDTGEFTGTFEIPDFMPSTTSDYYGIVAGVGKETMAYSSTATSVFTNMDFHYNRIMVPVGENGSTTEKDTDGDGIPDRLDEDDDGDLMPDEWETEHGLQPLVKDADGDKDEDGYSNLDEYWAGTNPDDDDDHPDHVDTVTLYSPAHLLIEDKEGNKIGWEDGQEVTTLPGAMKLEGEHESYRIYGGTDLQYNVIGFEEDTYGLTIEHERVIRESRASFSTQKLTVKAQDMPITGTSTNMWEIDWTAVEAEQPGVTVHIDEDGDGTFETYIITGRMDQSGNMVLGPDDIADSDGDHYSNTVDEFPDDPTEALDTDKDGIGNNADPDDDNDGMPDEWENKYTPDLNPYIPDADADPDDDGYSNLEEYKAGTNPADASSNPGKDDDDGSLLIPILIIVILLVIVLLGVLMSQGVIALGGGKEEEIEIPKEKEKLENADKMVENEGMSISPSGAEGSEADEEAVPGEETKEEE